jgi:hypothetical protein
MNRSKARDFFSDYFEDALSPGIRQTMDNAFASDAELRRDYEAFVALIGGLDALRSEEIEPIGFLSERIEARLNQVDQSRRAIQRPFLLRFWMPVTATAVAGAALLGFLVALQPQAGGDPSTAGMTGIGHNAPSTPKLSVEDGEIFLSYKPSGEDHITARLGVGGEIINSFSLDHDTLRAPLRNTSSEPALLEIESVKAGKLWVALPGQKHLAAGSGHGTVMDFAKALAGTYQMPVEISTKRKNAQIEWSLNGTSPINEVNDAMKGLGITIDVRESKVLLLSDY